MHIRHLKYIFIKTIQDAYNTILKVKCTEVYSVDEVVPVDVLLVFLTDTITMLFIQVRFLQKPRIFLSIPILLSTTVIHN